MRNEDYAEHSPHPYSPEVLALPGFDTPLGAPKYTTYQHMVMAATGKALRQGTFASNPVALSLSPDWHSNSLRTAFSPAHVGRDVDRLAEVVDAALTATTHRAAEMESGNQCFDVTELQAAERSALSRIGPHVADAIELLAANVSLDYPVGSAFELYADIYRQAMIAAVGRSVLSNPVLQILSGGWDMAYPDAA